LGWVRQSISSVARLSFDAQKFVGPDHRKSQEQDLPIMFWSRRLLVLLFAGFFALCSCAGLGTGAGTRSTLWKVKGRQNTVYLLGSIHLLPRTAYPLNRRLQTAFNDSQRLIFEVDLRKFTPANVQHEFRRTGFYTPPDRLSNHLSAEARTFLSAMLPSLGTSFARVQQFRSWFLAEVLSARYLQLLGYRDDLGVDLYFYRQAAAAGKPIQGLETLRDQAEIFTSFDDQRGEAYLLETLLGLPAYAKRVTALVKAWQNGQIRELDHLLNQHAQNDPASFRVLFAQRNSKWLPAIERLTDEPANYLVVVGTGHLVGDKGLVQELRQAGYDVQQL
jgi:uncharacterized protein YbaP (TraB family)